MSDDFLFRCFTALILGCSLAYGIHRRDTGMFRDPPIPAERVRSPIIAPLLLPIFLVVLALTDLIVESPGAAARNMAGLCFEVFLQICIYYIFLLALLPLLRRVISARAVAILWLLPNYLYLMFHSALKPDAPELVVKLDGRVFRWALAIWLAGFVLVMAFSILEHLRFRRRVLKNGKLPDSETFLIWENQQKRAGIPQSRLKLVVSDQVLSPLSVGLFRSTIRVVLPPKIYTPEELRLIFSHELVHIQRGDSQTKLFLRFCAAMCWFNPLMWIAAARCSEDLELSCDELVLVTADQRERQEYARLILSSAGDMRGFTTCLSAGAKGLRYRLRRIVSPGKRLAGGVIAGVLFFLLILSGGHTAFAYPRENHQPDIFAHPDSKVSSVLLRNGQSYVSRICLDTPALKQYLAGLKQYHLSGGYRFSDSSHEMTVVWDTPQGEVATTLKDHRLGVVIFGKNQNETRCWYLEESPDWDYLYSLMGEPPAETASLLPCWLYLDFGPRITPEREYIALSPTVLSGVRNGEPIEEGWRVGSPGGIYGMRADKVKLLFEVPPESFEVLVESWDRDTSYTVSGEDLTDCVLPLAPYSARYTVIGDFADESGKYHVSYSFEVKFRSE